MGMLFWGVVWRDSLRKCVFACFLGCSGYKRGTLGLVEPPGMVGWWFTDADDDGVQDEDENGGTFTATRESTSGQVLPQATTQATSVVKAAKAEAAAAASAAKVYLNEAEEASAELMSIAVSRMSDEVVALIEARTGEIKSALDRNEELLLNILPKSIADRKLADEKVIADAHESCSILFGDIVGFTQLSKDLGAERLVEFLDEVFTKFDDFSDELGLEKIKTIGDNYMVACGVPHFDPEHPYKIAEMGQRMVRYIQSMDPIHGHIPAMRIGIHSGPLVAGVIGKRKFIYDLWGDAVNTAARMESHGIPNKIHMSAETAGIIKDRFAIESRGVMEIKGKGPMETFLLSA